MKSQKTTKRIVLLLSAILLFVGLCSPCTPTSAALPPKNGVLDFSKEGAAFEKLIQEYDLYATIESDAEIPVYRKASPDSAVVKTIDGGWQVQLTGAALHQTGLFYEISFAVRDKQYSGYISGKYVVSADERLAEWEAEYLPDQTTQLLWRGAAKGAAQASAFPESYRPMIRELLKAHPNWKFVPMNTGLNWEDVIKAEMADSRNLVQTVHPDSWKSKKPGDYDAKTGKWKIKSGTDWVQASEAIVRYYMDPRNFLTEESVFQFEQLVYGSHHTKAGVEKILNGTFMARKKLEDGSAGKITYAQAFMKIGKSLKVSPYFLASRVRQEQGVKGDSPLISGTYPGYKGYYNYFNRRASGVGTEVIVRGLEEAKANGWNTRYKALKGGAKSTASDFIYKGQDTLYLQKFDVDASYDGLYWHQYMQNLLAADNEGKNVQKAYREMGILNKRFVFKIPVYKSMPEYLSPKPEEGLTKPALKLKQNGYASVKLSWKATAAEGYQIYRATGKNGGFQKKATVKSGACAYEDTSVIPGKQYRYKIRSYRKENGKNRYSSYSEIKSADFAIPACSWGSLKPKNYKTIALSWKKAPVDGYQIYRKTEEEGYRLIQTIKGKASTGFRDTTVTPGHTYTYRIRGYISANGKNYTSPYTLAKSTELIMKKPEWKKAAASGADQIKLTWKRDAMADGYFIYRSLSEKGGYEKIKTIEKNKTVKWTDTDLEAGTTYYYKIRSYVKLSSGTKSSGYSAAVGVEVSETE